MKELVIVAVDNTVLDAAGVAVPLENPFPLLHAYEIARAPMCKE